MGEDKRLERKVNPETSEENKRRYYHVKDIFVSDNFKIRIVSSPNYHHPMLSYYSDK